MEPNRQLPDGYGKRIIIRQLVPFAVFFAILWAWFLVRWLGDIDAFTWFNHKEPLTSVGGAAIVVAVGSLLIVCFGWLQARRALHLATRGVCVTAKITSVGRVGRGGMVPVRYSYSFEGKVFEMAMDMLKKDAIMGREAELIIDPKNPKKAILFDRLFPSARPTKE